MKWEKVRCLRRWAEPGSPPGLTPHLHLPAPLPGASSHPEAPADPGLATRPPAPDIPSSGAPVSRKQGAVGRSHPSADPQGLSQLEGPVGTQLPAHSRLMQHRAGEGQCPPSREAAGPGLAWPGGTHVLKLSSLQGQDPQDPVLVKRV